MIRPVLFAFVSALALGACAHHGGYAKHPYTHGASEHGQRMKGHGHKHHEHHEHHEDAAPALAASPPRPVVTYSTAPATTYSVAPKTTYSTTPATTYSTAPTTTYSVAPSTSYSYSAAPSTSYSYSTAPSTSYAYSTAPSTSYTYSAAPSSSYSYSAALSASYTYAAAPAETASSADTHIYVPGDQCNDRQATSSGPLQGNLTGGTRYDCTEWGRASAYSVSRPSVTYYSAPAQPMINREPVLSGGN